MNTFYSTIILLLALTFKYVNADTLSIGVGNYYYYPQHSIKDGQFVGYARELFDQFEKYSGHKFNYRPLPWKRVVHEYVNGKLDMIYPDNPFWDQEHKKGINVIYSKPAISYTDGLIVKKSNKDISIDSIKSISTLRGFTVWDYLSYIDSGIIKLNEVETLEAMYQQLLVERSNAAYGEISVIQYYFKNEIKNNNTFVFRNDLPYTKDYFYLSSIKRPDIIKQFNTFLKIKENDIEKLKQKYNLK